MLERFMIKGAQDACASLKLGAVDAGMLGGLLGKAKSFGSGQLAAGKDLVSNLRGGFGGKMNPSLIEGAVPPQSMDMAKATHRQQALGNLKTLAPTLLAGGGLYMMHHHKQQQEEQARQQAAMQGGGGGGGGYPMM
jgi:hypothetical protein